MVIKTSVFL